MAHKAKNPKSAIRLGVGLLAILAIPIIIYISFRARYDQLIFPQTFIGTMPVTGLSEKQAEAKQIEAINKFVEGKKLTILVEGKEWELPLTVIRPQYNPTETAFAAYASGRTGTIEEQLRNQWQNFNQGVTIVPRVTLDEEALEMWLATLAAQLTTPPIPPHIAVTDGRQKTPTVKVVPGQDGRVLETETIKAMVRERVINWNNEPIQAQVSTVAVIKDPQILEEAKQTAEKLLTKELKLTVDDPYVVSEWQLKGPEMIDLIEIGNGFDQNKIRTYLSAAAEGINREPTNAKFNFNANANKVEEFVAAKNGLNLDVEKSTATVNEALMTLTQGGEATQTALAVTITKPTISMENANDLGIKELLGRGTSTYKGSIPTRVHNVGLAATRINGSLVPPGETFSFNEAVGEVSSQTGYQQAYVIKNGRTQLGDGGGVCQDSTTVFRAALNAGLPISERKAHAYRVGYYEQDTKAGIDATVYAPSPDLKFINDTPAHLLIQAKADEPNRALTVEIYGTSDGRTSEIKNHVVWDITPPPPDVYIDDPTMKAGQVKQVDWKAGGAKAKFDYLVRRNGEVIMEKTFYSTYKPWAAVFMRGTAP